jgi:hypothetical protein
VETRLERKGELMSTREYVSRAEVQEVCRELGIRDWTRLTEARVLMEEAEIIQKEIGGEAELISSDEFRQGLEVELEHGLAFPDANVTNNHPILTGKIVLAHLKEMLDYYARLEVAELEGDLLKASRAGDLEKLARKYQQLLEARGELAAREKAAAVKAD